MHGNQPAATPEAVQAHQSVFDMVRPGSDVGSVGFGLQIELHAQVLAVNSCSNSDPLVLPTIACVPAAFDTVSVWLAFSDCQERDEEHREHLVYALLHNGVAAAVWAVYVDGSGGHVRLDCCNKYIHLDSGAKGTCQLT